MLPQYQQLHLSWYNSLATLMTIILQGIGVLAILSWCNVHLMCNFLDEILQKNCKKLHSQPRENCIYKHYKLNLFPCKNLILSKNRRVSCFGYDKLNVENNFKLEGWQPRTLHKIHFSVNHSHYFIQMNWIFVHHSQWNWYLSEIYIGVHKNAFRDPLLRGKEIL